MKKINAAVRTATLNRLNDRLFKFIFASEQNKDFLIFFLNSILDKDRQIIDLEYMDKEFDPFLEDGKLSHFDVRAKTADGRIFHVEVQVADEEDFFKRSLFYVSNTYATQIGIGEPYEKLKPVIFVGILNFEMFPDNPKVYHCIHKLMDIKTHKCYCGDIEFHYLEIPKLRKLKKTPRTGLERLLSYMGSIGGAEGLKQMASVDPTIEKILKLEEVFVTRPQEWVGYLMRERAQSDYEHLLAKKLAKKQREGMLEVAKNMLRDGCPVDKIVQYTSLPREEVEALLD
jgi:predicted transposase/invertase (TIGR01784 family)